jgi:hypothetical protein
MQGASIEQLMAAYKDVIAALSAEFTVPGGGRLRQMVRPGARRHAPIAD